jgi:Asp-tRNA(Asn)/Glu-tRNA(Gln) amidotransferase A subunit family amidase
MPLAIKDNLCTECADHLRFTHAATFHPPYDATVIAKLREQDYILLGKTNLDEFAMGCQPNTPPSARAAIPGTPLCAGRFERRIGRCRGCG